MEPIKSLTKDLTGILEDIAEKRDELDRESQKLLLDSLRKLLIATQCLDKQLTEMTKVPGHRRRRYAVLHLVR